MNRAYCIFGDSISQASYVKTGWVELLRMYLEEKYPNDFVNVFNLGIGGNTTKDLLRRFENEIKVRMPSTIIFQIGTNDSGYFREITNLITPEDQFKNNLQELIDSAKKYTEDITCLGLAIGDDSLTQPLPSSSKGKSYTKGRVKKYDNIIKSLVEQDSCKYIHLFDKLDNKDFMDGLHPNESGQRKMFESIKKYF